eukprot:GHVU01132042.1.p1 GENE.GHVU01132042.1~~GHVU01132042.1.p1  ORF type:complete len:419 (+),score=85.46 GHVU01132042.1:4045-5301(+)
MKGGVDSREQPIEGARPARGAARQQPPPPARRRQQGYGFLRDTTEKLKLKESDLEDVEMTTGIETPRKREPGVINKYIRPHGEHPEADTGATTIEAVETSKVAGEELREEGTKRNVSKGKLVQETDAVMAAADQSGVDEAPGKRERKAVPQESDEEISETRTGRAEEVAGKLKRSSVKKQGRQEDEAEQAIPGAKAMPLDESENEASESRRRHKSKSRKRKHQEEQEESDREDGASDAVTPPKKAKLSPLFHDAFKILKIDYKDLPTNRQVNKKYKKAMKRFKKEGNDDLTIPTKLNEARMLLRGLEHRPFLVLFNVSKLGKKIRDSEKAALAIFNLRPENLTPGNLPTFEDIDELGEKMRKNYAGDLEEDLQLKFNINEAIKRVKQLLNKAGKKVSEYAEYTHISQYVLSCEHAHLG